MQQLLRLRGPIAAWSALAVLLLAQPGQARTMTVTAIGPISFISSTLLPTFHYGQNVLVVFSYDDATPAGFHANPQSATYYAISSLLVESPGLGAIGVFPNNLGPITLENDLPTGGAFLDDWTWSTDGLSGSPIGIYSPEWVSGTLAAANSADTATPLIPPTLLASTALDQPVPVTSPDSSYYVVYFRTPSQSQAAYISGQFSTITAAVPEPGLAEMLAFGVLALTRGGRRAQGTRPCATAGARRGSPSSTRRRSRLAGWRAGRET